MSKVFVLIVRNVPHVARNVWLCGCFRFVPIYIRYIQWVQTPYSHVASNVRYVTHLGVLTQLSFPLRTNSILTPCKQGAVLSRYSIGLAMRINSLLTRCEQRAVRYLAMRTNSLLTPCKQGAVLSRYSLFPNENELLTHVTIFGHSKVRHFPVTPSRPRNIIHANPRLLQIAANEPLMNCCEMLTRFGFRGKMY